ncbi:5-deoxyglucuronate isomerase [Devosia limi DSM 17137]|uniref:5-deoxy-glucuronate isomerase n=1 Tax=Devosia limi DSM 17137 TaxID=1121477 RepID=A0A0F5LNT4_9HYPH|nr:5-deoxy-glucuronate isomerase [Devosia limi]KKB83993.1 5-deoxyglucuronate isomerase [Devosia limi DSM 17137]SHF99099.1 5-deoxy-glucuronate isomerase [Devosia limi DSM 17137]
MATTPNLRVRPKGNNGLVHEVTPDSARWTYVGFALHKLDAGASAGGSAESDELCLVLVSGKARISVDGVDLGELGERMSPFEGQPYAVYVPAGSIWSAEATTALDLAVCAAPGQRGKYPARVIPPGTHALITRGKGANVRHVTNILPETDPAHSLLVVEVITPGGNTSSYPPHKHDTDNLPHESFLEETYYHRLNPPQGFAMQRVYTDDRSLDEALVIEDGDVTLVPKGYHPVATTAGYDLYYLNVMAGPKRTWKFHNAPEHEWLLK